MKIETQEIIDRVLFMDFDSQWDLAMSFVRIQEFQESPKFRGKYFTLDQYMDYWVKGQGEGKWDYPNRWGGFNLSGKIIEKFMLKFDDLRDKEKEIVNIIDHYVSSKENKKTSMKDIYVIASKGYREYYDEEKKVKRRRPRHGWISNVMPKILRVDAIKKDGSEVKVSWPAGKCLGKWVDNPNKPGYMMWNLKTERLLHEWVPTHYCLNVTDYVLGDYKMFLCDRSLQGQYLKWARYLLRAEDWQRNRKNGVKIEEDELALTRG